MRKETKDFIKELEDMGLVVKTSGTTHFKCYTHDDKWVMDFASSPGDRNWREAATRMLVGRLKAIYSDSG